MSKHILVVEDDQALCQMYKLKLDNVGYRASSALSGEEALRFLLLETVDLIILDIILPGKNGIMVLKEIRKDSRLKNIPVVILTNLAKADLTIDDHLSKTLGVKYYLIKSKINPTDLVGIIDDCLK